MLWVIFALLTGIAVFSILWPLARAPRNMPALEHDVGFYHEQIEEIARDRARAVLSAEETETAQAEAGRRLIAASERGSEKPASGSHVAMRIAAGFTLLFVPLLTLGLYGRIGHPDWPDQPLLARMNAPPDRMDLAAALAKVEAHVAQNPGDSRGYDVLIPTYIRLGRLEDAVRTERAALENLGETPQRLAAYGQLLVEAARGEVTEEASRVFEKAAAHDPPLPEALFYLGLAAAQKNDTAKAKETWEKLLAQSPQDAPWRGEVAARIAALGKASVPDGGEAIAALPQTEREQAIRGMVARLAGRLSENGQDLEGWLRLIRAYKVLNDESKARDALATARKTFDGDPAGRARIDALARELGLNS
jgi:cytochrome c-type biogenesis protein CcmH